MPQYVALLRAVNVAGHPRITADELVAAFAAAGAGRVSSFGHAGNVLFAAPDGARTIAARVRDRLEQRHGERPLIVLRTADEVAALVAAEPFAGRATARPVKLYVAFLARKPRLTPMLPLHSAAERLTAFAMLRREVLVASRPKPSGFYGFPNAFVETAFGVAATSRNWSTVTRLAQLLGG